VAEVPLLAAFVDSNVYFDLALEISEPELVSRLLTTPKHHVSTDIIQWALISYG